MRLSNLSFEDWLEHAFSHEVRDQRAAWYFDEDCDFWDPKPGQAVDYLTRLFEYPEDALHYFSDAQIAQGLTYLVSTSASGDSGWLYSRDVLADHRVRCVNSVASFFKKIFVPRCTAHLSHLSEADAGTLNCVCYMLWDEFPSIALAGDPDLPQLHNAALGTMETILGLDSLACQESALHGLGHWQSQYPTEVAAIIDRFLARQPNDRIVNYANAARCGCVL